MQDRAVCFLCAERIDHSPMFAAPCDHPDCPSVCWHGIHLMEWREHRDAYLSGADGIAIVAIFEKRRR